MVKRTLYILPLLITQYTTASHLRHPQHRRNEAKQTTNNPERQTLSMSDLLGKTSTFISQSSMNNNSNSTSTSNSATDFDGERTGSNDVALTFESSSSSSSSSSTSGGNSNSDSDSNVNIHELTGSNCRRSGGCKKNKNKNRQNTRGNRTRGGENI